MRNLLGLAVAAMLALSLAPGVAAQGTYTIDGIVTDQDGAPVQGATVGWSQMGACEAWVVNDADTSKAMEPDLACYEMEASNITGPDGRFSFSSEAGWGSLSVWKDGHASHYQGIEVSGDQHVEVQLLRFPEKTARIEGSITPDASISIENPVYGVYECSQHEDGSGAQPEPRPMEGEGGSDGSTDAAMTIAPGEPYSGCAITVRADGSYSGNVTPGYSIIRVHGGWSEGGQSHYGHSIVRDLPSNATTRIDVALKARPGPDATLSGYVVDGATKTAIPDVQVSFSNQDNYGWASAQTDKDGSYKVALRSGFVQVHVWADGYLPWEGQVELSGDAERSLDITLTAGQSRYGGCCMAYPAMGEAESLEKSSGQDAAGQDGASQDDFEDLGGGLGPYDPARADADAERESPGMEVFAFIGLLCLLAFVRRR